MAASPVDVVGSGPISFTNSEGAQKFVPLSAFQFLGSTIQLSSAWSASFDSTDTPILLAVAQARAASGELTPPPIPPPRTAVALTAKHAGPESNGIVVSVTPDAGPALTAGLAFTAVQTWSYPGLATAKAAAQAVGVDTPGGGGSPPAGTGVVVIKAASVANGGDLPDDDQTGVLTSAGTDVKSGAKVLFTLVPAADYTGTGGISFTVKLDPSGTTFTVTTVYDSTKESGAAAKVTIQTLDSLPDQVAYLVGAGAPPGGAALPAASSVTLSGGGPGLAANGFLYTS